MTHSRECYVKWPEGMESSGENGMAVLVVFPETDWMDCRIELPVLPQPDVITNAWEIDPKLWPKSGPDRDYWHSADLLAAVTLGSTGDTFVDGFGGYFKASMDDLTPEGVELVNLLSKLYGVPPVLLTLLDT